MLESIISFANEQRASLHLLLHVLVPLVVAFYLAPKAKWKMVFMVMVATMVVDVDHLLATPIYAPNRCSILFHPLHQVLPMVVYALMVIWPLLVVVLKRKLKPVEFWTGWVGLGLVIHMLLDGVDCYWMRLSY
jgi:hypothetical protein